MDTGRNPSIGVGAKQGCLSNDDALRLSGSPAATEEAVPDWPAKPSYVIPRRPRTFPSTAISITTPLTKTAAAAAIPPPLKTDQITSTSIHTLPPKPIDQFAMGVLIPRRTCTTYRNGYPYRTTCNSAWTVWVRWLVAGIVIFFAFAFFAFVLCCISRRRKRSRRYATNPMPMAPQNVYNGPPPQDPSPQQGGYYNPGPYSPPQGAPPTYGDQNNTGYYPPQQGGVTQPQGAYQPPKW
ncbi:uncharacterized protein BP5553_05129 [Venustampulla echinocandica]|uniref:Chitin synthesis regulation, Congo red resistance, RCR protein n=1 Tax=Venustampulla echinocandica TaxID=2656787 RepID=A0A370TQA0_9HELO|nr:uncharacterized protein BP5553_05129 [Venustampulla echinocandica]RDL37696.1 hypothetical protein BP5553_05129 [Venustampulla echinocandica]